MAIGRAQSQAFKVSSEPQELPMNTLYSILYMVTVIGLLLASVVLSETLYLRSPSGVLLLFGLGLFMSLGFVLFGHIRFDEQPGEEHDENSLRS